MPALCNSPCYIAMLGSQSPAARHRESLDNDHTSIRGLFPMGCPGNLKVLL